MTNRQRSLLKKTIAVIVSFAMASFSLGAGVWLLSQTTYDFWRSVGGWTICSTAAFAVFVGTVVAQEWEKQK